mmetsp:Transcript_17573/g.43387  ORF Transcript_17573/g.43387 Transcript_17573/m.43387 type:complete len:150 (-) Transcript_17573:1633-2082(-)
MIILTLIDVVTRIFTFRSATTLLIHLRHDGIADAFDLLELFLVFFLFRVLIVIKPIKGFLHNLLDGTLVFCLEFVGKLVTIGNSVLHVVHVRLEAVASIHTFLDFPVLLGKFFGLLNHSLNFLLRKASFVVGDGNFLRLSSALVFGADI